VRASLTSLDGRLHGFSADDAALSWSIFGGPMMCDLPGDFSANDIANMRLATLTVDGSRGPCWSGKVTGVTQERIDAGGPNLALSMMRPRDWIVCDTSLAGWSTRTATDCNQAIRITKQPGQLRMGAAAGADWPAGAHNGFVYRFPQAVTSAVVTGSAWLSGPVGRMYLYRGATSAIVAGEDIAWSNGTQITTGSFSITQASTAFNYLLFHFVWPEAAVELAQAVDLMAVSDIKVYGTPVTNSTPSNIINYALDQSGISATNRDIDTTEAALVPFTSTDTTPLGLVQAVLNSTGGRFQWIPRRVNGAVVWLAKYGLADNTVAYEIDARDTDTDFSGVDIEHAATHAEVRYSSVSGSTRTLERETTSGFLGKHGVEKWIKVDATQTTDATLAAHLGDLALAEAAYDRHAGTVTVESVRDTNGVEVPLEHLQCGRRVRVRTLGRTVTPRLVEYRMNDGNASLTLDDSPYALDIALANLARK